MGQVALELAYSLIIEGLCYGTGYLILRILGFRNLDRRETLVVMVGLLFWVVVGLVAWRLLSA